MFLPSETVSPKLAELVTYGMPTNTNRWTLLLVSNFRLAAKENADELLNPLGLLLPEDERPVFVTTDSVKV